MKQLENPLVLWFVTAVLLGGLLYSSVTAFQNGVEISHLKEMLSKEEATNEKLRDRFELLNVEIIKLNHTQSTVERNIVQLKQQPGTKTDETMGNDQVSDTDVNDEMSSILNGREDPKPPLPDGPNHVMTFIKEPISTGEGLKANSVTEAWVMAYIEKHMGDFSYKNIPIYMYGDRSGKRDAIIRLVKDQGADLLLDEIAPKK